MNYLTGWDKMIRIGANWVQICINQLNNFAVDGVREVFWQTLLPVKSTVLIFVFTGSLYQSYWTILM